MPPGRKPSQLKKQIMSHKHALLVARETIVSGPNNKTILAGGDAGEELERYAAGRSHYPMLLLGDSLEVLGIISPRSKNRRNSAMRHLTRCEYTNTRRPSWPGRGRVLGLWRRRPMPPRMPGERCSTPARLPAPGRAAGRRPRRRPLTPQTLCRPAAPLATLSTTACRRSLTSYTETGTVLLNRAIGETFKTIVQ